MSESLRALRTTLAFGFRAAPRHSSILVACSLLVAMSGPALAYGAKLLIDAAVAGSAARGVVAVVILAVTAAIGIVAALYYVDSVFNVFERAQAAADRELMRLLGGAEGLAHFENPDHADEVIRIRETRTGLGSMVTIGVGALRVAVTFVVTAVLLAAIHPALLALALAGPVSIWVSKRSRDLQVAAHESTSEHERLRHHVFDVGTDAGAGKELRVFGLTDEIRRRHHVLSDKVIRERNRADWRGARVQTVDALTNSVAFIAAITGVLLLAVDGRATPGDVVLVIGLALELGVAITGAATTGNVFLWALKTARRLVRLEDYVRSADTTPSDPAPVPTRLREGIELREVSFTYPGSTRPTLHEITVRLVPGSVVAIVGENGAGKTTLAKLLSGYYRPDAGSITVDGTDLARIAVRGWQQRITAAYQDRVAFEFRARETIGISDRTLLDDDRELFASLQRADAADLVAALPDGLDSQLGIRWPRGVELSGGQWQKLALARGLHRTLPLLTILDEPASALDAQTEHSLHQHISAAARTNRHRGTITLLITHRFSTVAAADHILVLREGRIIEAGDHQELIGLDGLYAELYDLQVRAYR